jgi:hypothetical protein
MPDDTNPQVLLFDLPEINAEHWKGMPSYLQRDLEPYRTVYVHFENREAVAAFFKLMDQQYTPDTQMIWFPKAEIAKAHDKRWAGPESRGQGDEDENEVDPE